MYIWRDPNGSLYLLILVYSGFCVGFCCLGLAFHVGTGLNRLTGLPVGLFCVLFFVFFEGLLAL